MTTVHKAGSKIPTWLTVSPVYKHLPQILFTGPFFRWHYFALMSIYLIVPAPRYPGQRKTIMLCKSKFKFKLYPPPTPHPPRQRQWHERPCVLGHNYSLKGTVTFIHSHNLMTTKNHHYNHSIQHKIIFALYKLQYVLRTLHQVRISIMFPWNFQRCNDIPHSTVYPTTCSSLPPFMSPLGGGGDKLLCQVTVTSNKGQ